MRRRRFTQYAAAGMAASVTASAWRPAAAAQLVTEIFTVGYRPLDEIIPLLRPLVPQPGSVGGIGDQLVVRTTPENMEDIRRVLGTINKAPANLLISVRSNVGGSSSRSGIDVYGMNRVGDVEIGAGKPPADDRGLTVGDARSGVRVVRTHSTDDDRGIQTVRVLEGREAFISAGRSIPVADSGVVITGPGITTIQGGVRYQDVTQGFYVRPRLAGDQVTLEISPHHQRVSREGGGAIDVAGASTVASGRLGEWIPLGGVTADADRSDRGITAQTRSRSSREYGLSVKVERLE